MRANISSTLLPSLLLLSFFVLHCLFLRVYRFFSPSLEASLALGILSLFLCCFVLDILCLFSSLSFLFLELYP